MNAMFKKTCTDTTHLLWKEPARGPYSDWPKTWTKAWWYRMAWLIVIFGFIAMMILIIVLNMPDMSAQ